MYLEVDRVVDDSCFVAISTCFPWTEPDCCITGLNLSTISQAPLIMLFILLTLILVMFED